MERPKANELEPEEGFRAPIRCMNVTLPRWSLPMETFSFVPHLGLSFHVQAQSDSRVKEEQRPLGVHMRGPSEAASGLNRLASIQRSRVSEKGEQEEVNPQEVRWKFGTRAIGDCRRRLNCVADPLPITTIIPSKEDVIAAWTSSSQIVASDPHPGSRTGCRRKREQILIPLGPGQVAEGEVEGLLKGTGAALNSEAMHMSLRHPIHCPSGGSIPPRTPAFLSGTVPCNATYLPTYRAIEYDNLIRNATMRLPGLQIINLWTPAHIGTVGNELADTAAKAATLLPPSHLSRSLSPLASAKSTLICWIAGGLSGRWQKQAMASAKLTVLHPRLSYAHLTSPPCLARSHPSWHSSAPTSPP
ncbi:hypothetical protein C8R43DRAFT_1107162 [Mycena crocata]|nr:hypothetical protein C8R43DRAFT_1107162 [Mycena crocata]